MTTNDSSPDSPSLLISRLANGYRATLTLLAAVQLHIPEELEAGPRTVSELANALAVDPDSLYRLLRALASLGIFREVAPKTFAHTPASDALRASAPGSMRAMVEMTATMQLPVWQHLAASVRSGHPAFDRVFGRSLFEHLAKDDAAARMFDAAMAGHTGSQAAAIADSYDFARFSSIADIGGGSGALLCAVLARHTGPRGIAFDVPHVADRARTLFEEAGLASRCAVESGSFFEAVPAGADAYVLKRILHDWDDERSRRILAVVRRAMPPKGKLLVIEAVVPEGNQPSITKMIDLNMMVVTGGRERTEAEYRTLLASAGFVVDRLVPAGGLTVIVEASPA